VAEVVDLGVAAREEQRLVPGVRSADQVRRSAVGAAHLEDLALALRLTHVVAADHELITDRDLHRLLLSNDCGTTSIAPPGAVAIQGPTALPLGRTVRRGTSSPCADRPPRRDR
jgi:hypothetical protein